MATNFHVVNRVDGNRLIGLLYYRRDSNTYLSPDSYAIYILRTLQHLPKLLSTNILYTLVLPDLISFPLIQQIHLIMYVFTRPIPSIPSTFDYFCITPNGFISYFINTASVTNKSIIRLGINII